MFESEVGAMDATILSVAARLKEATGLLHDFAQAPKAREAAKANASATVKPAAKPAAKPAEKVSGPAKVAARSSTSAAAKPAEVPEVHMVDPKKQAAVEALLKQHNKTAAMVAEKEILDGLFAHLKGNIMRFNTQEKKDKGESSEQVVKLKARLAQDQKRLKDSKDLSAFEHEVLVNRTRLEEHEVQYWSRGRDLQHGAFHANLKLTHGLMSRVKTIMEAYQQALKKGKVDSKTLKSLDSISLPKAFVQMRVALRKLAKTHRKRLLHETRLLY